MENIQDVLVNAKDKMPTVTPTPPSFHSQATVHELKSRLQWGEPGLTILDVRDREDWNECHIQGAIPLPMDSLENGYKPNLPIDRDIYVYGTSEEQTTSAANALRQAGFRQVAELKGGLKAWEEVYGAIDGFATTGRPSKGAYNVVSRMKEFAEERAKEKQLDRQSNNQTSRSI
ncbi:rhodanese-like domain-containing protein [Kovacikia minuta CCNUW1]|uniref:rhodanese-like domain-containing protein n=1 Tax=Kovacikia minuta TaxID=2931930 RepID=UPI001CCACD61|nr:rhodanese-like domain-containing protein [Kovacikia minuta]UBF29235.1 rhodanese-like domain-containing protein [Kovacikia minuta CCNUW1]